jgi:hypothetical protein
MAVLRGRVASTGQTYASGLERWTVDVPMSEAGQLPTPRGRVRIDLTVGGNTYVAGIRATRGYVYICANLLDAAGEKTNLATVLGRLGYVRNQPVRLEVEGHRTRLSPIPDPAHA